MSEHLPEQTLFAEISGLIEQTRTTVIAQANHTVIRLYWKIGSIINTAILQDKRADYGKRIVSALATQLQSRFGRSFELRNLRRMMQFADQFMVAEYWTDLPPKQEFEQKIHALLEEARERLARRRGLTGRDKGASISLKGNRTPIK
jgi:hypothetical protein